MAKVIQCVSYAPQEGRWLTSFKGLQARLWRARHRPARLNPVEWSGHMLRDVGLPERLGEDLPSRRQMNWMR